MRTVRHTVARWLQQALRLAAICAIGSQFLVPYGYMPGSVADGTPFVFCGMVTPRTEQHGSAHAGPKHSSSHMAAEHMAAGHPDTAIHDEHAGGEAWEHCPLGALGAGAALAFALTPKLNPAGTDRVSTDRPALLRSAAVVNARARAPPEMAIALIV